MQTTKPVGNNPVRLDNAAGDNTPQKKENAPIMSNGVNKDAKTYFPTGGEILSNKEFRKLSNTPCENPALKNAALVSAYTGLRYYDLKTMKWSNISEEGDNYSINLHLLKGDDDAFHIQITEKVYRLCGERKNPDTPVFEGLPSIYASQRLLMKWAEAAGINKDITFRSFRRTYLAQYKRNHDVNVSMMIGKARIMNIHELYCFVKDCNSSEKMIDRI